MQYAPRLGMRPRLKPPEPALDTSEPGGDEQERRRRACPAEGESYDDEGLHVGQPTTQSDSQTAHRGTSAKAHA